MQRLQIHSGGRYLQTADGEPFFWMGDTCWEMLGRMTRSQIVTYLDNRKERGFNVIQIVGLTEYSTNVNNKEGQKPLIGLNPDTPNSTYWELLTYVLQQAEAREMYIALVPAWGDKVEHVSGDIGPIMFTTANGKANAFGQFIGNLCEYFDNVVFVLGGDRFGDAADDRTVWLDMGAGIVTGYGDGALISYHPRGGGWSSAKYPDLRAFVDFHMLQSGHQRNREQGWGLISTSQSTSRLPMRPVVDAEICYEDHPEGGSSLPSAYRMTPFDVRKAMYRTVFAGGMGVTYGHNSIWQVYEPPFTAKASATAYWYTAINSDGSAQVKYLKNLMLSVPFFNRIPDQSMMINPPSGLADVKIATRDSDGSYGLIYSPTNIDIVIDMSKFSAPVIGKWFNPRTGAITTLGEYANTGQRTFTPPDGNDWVLAFLPKQSSPLIARMTAAISELNAILQEMKSTQG